MDLSGFKADDIRGLVPAQLNEGLAEKIGRAYVAVTGAKRVIVGYDIRLSSSTLATAVALGLTAAGADAYNIGMCGAEQVYFSTFFYGMDGGIMITGSHNPKEYNGIKLVAAGAIPICADTGLQAIKEQVLEAHQDASTPGMQRVHPVQQDYVRHLLSYVDRDHLTPLKIVVNAGNGGAGQVIDHLEQHLPFTFIKIHHAPDGAFPHGVPNPLLPENRASTCEAVLAHGADMGVAWDGDYDRCFLFDAAGRFIESYYIVGLLAEHFMRREAGAAVIHDPRLTWNTVEVVEAYGGKPVESETGHALIKKRMREEQAIYGGEMSGHHYFREFAYCDSGMIPWLLMAEMMCSSGKTIMALVDERMARFPASGEINRNLTDPVAVINTIEANYAPTARSVSHVDGLSVEYDTWRFNLRVSKTEPLVRLNVESKGDRNLMEAKTQELLAAIDTINAA